MKLAVLKFLGFLFLPWWKTIGWACVAYGLLLSALAALDYVDLANVAALLMAVVRG